jgi:SAM-dependent methyltransferase
MIDPLSIIILIALPFLITFAWGGISAAPWVPTMKRDREHLLNNLDFKPGQIVYDLGCGDGSVLFAIAKRQPEIKAVGLEISLLPFWLALTRKYLGHYEQVSLRYQNLFKSSLKDADVVFAFLLPKCYPRLVAKFATELRPEALVIVEAWPLPNIEPEKTLMSDKLLPIYLYSGRQFK